MLVPRSAMGVMPGMPYGGRAPSIATHARIARQRPNPVANPVVPVAQTATADVAQQALAKKVAYLLKEGGFFSSVGSGLLRGGRALVGKLTGRGLGGAARAPAGRIPLANFRWEN